MSPRIISTHLIALALGMSGAAFFTDKKTSTTTAQHAETADSRSGPSGTTRPARADRRPLDALWSELANTPMESRHRFTLKNGMLDQWAEEDPLALLEFLDDRPWDAHIFGMTPGTRAIDQLAEQDPEALLGYALRSGNRTALWTLATTGDPKVALDRMLGLGEDVLPEGLIHRLFSDAANLDPDFYQLAFTLGSKGEEAILASAEVLFETGRHATMDEWLSEIPDSFPNESFGARMAEMCLDDDANPTWIHSLPTGSQQAAIDYAFGDSGAFALSITASAQQRFEWVQDLHAHGLIDPSAHLKHSTLSPYLPVNDFYNSDPFATHENRADLVPTGQAWKAWADELPNDPAYHQTKLSIYQNIISLEPEQWSQFLEVPDSQLRDLTLAGSVDQLEPDLASEVITHIENPETRQQAADYLAWLQETKEDPFADFEGSQPWDLYHNDPFAAPDPFAEP